MSRTGSRSPAELRALVRERDGDACCVCGWLIDFTRAPGTWLGPSLEHLIPLAAGGTNDPGNLRLSHAYPCNKEKGAVHNGVDYNSRSVQAVRVRVNPNDARARRRRGGLADFEAWSAARR